MSNLAIADGTVVTIHYALHDADGKSIDASRGGEPLAYLHGAGGIVAGLERALTGRVPGDKLNVVVSPEDGYGLATGPGPQPVPRREFGPRANQLRPGMPVRVADSSGGEHVLWVHEIRGSRVYVDSNHPLAGKELHFEIEVVGVRPASEEERSHGHVHGAGGHHH